VNESTGACFLRSIVAPVTTFTSATSPGGHNILMTWTPGRQWIGRRAATYRGDASWKSPSYTLYLRDSPVDREYKTRDSILKSERPDKVQLGVATGFAVWLFLLCAALLPAGLLAGSARIIIDGEFADWEGIDPVAVDQTGDQNPSALDFANLWVANDEGYLFVALELIQEINLQNDNQIRMFLDTDDDPATGIAAHGIGAELVWDCGARSGTFTSTSGSYEVEQAEVGVVAGPTVTSEIFEIAFDRSATPHGSTPLFPGATIRIVIEDLAGTDRIPDGAGGAPYIFDDTPLEPLPSLSLSRHDDTHLRIVSYNVLTDGLFESWKRPNFNRLLAALDPDIIGFQEIYDHSALETENRVEAILPSSGQDRWYSAEAGYDIKAVSRYPITRSFTVTGNGVFLIDLRPTYEKDLLLIVAHPPCCDNDAGRQREIDAFMAFIRNAKAPGGLLDIAPETPIVIVGDMNLVGQRQQLETMLTGNIINVGTYGPPFSPDWDGSDLEDAIPRATDLPMAFTWYHDWGSYWPGRLDYIVYTGSVLETGNSFIAFTPAMSADTLAAYGLEADDAVLASDHLPVVADFAIPVSVAEVGIHCLDVGHGDCTLIVSPAGGTLLLDAGGNGKGLEVVAPYLESLGIGALDYVVASNYNPEHIGGIDEVVEHLGIDSVRVAVLDRGWSGSDAVYAAYEGSVNEKRAAITEGQVIDLGGGLTVTCVGVNGNGELAPPFDDTYDEADLGIALVVDYLGFDFFVAGDLPGVDVSGHSDIESSIAREVGDVDVYRVSSHGSGVSSGENLVSALLPEVAIVSVGNDGPSGYPDQGVLDRLIGYGSYIYQTELGTGARIPTGSGEVVDGNVVLRVTAEAYTLNGSSTYEVEADGIPILEVRVDDANGEPILLGQRVRVRGIVTAGSGVFSGSDNNIFIQDATGGLNVFQQSAIEPEVTEGDKIEVEGFVDHLAGLTRITSPTIGIKASGVNVPQPIVLTTQEIATDGADYEGSLVRVNEVYITGGTWPAVGSDGTVFVDDGSGECTLFIDEDAGIPGASEIPDTFDVTGLLGQHDTAFPFLSGYRVMPRSGDDIVPSYDDGGISQYGLVAGVFPSPARRHVRIKFTRPAVSHGKRISFYDVRGRKVARAEAAPGLSYLDWVAEDASGRALASGIYFAVVSGGGREETVKLVIMR